MESISIPPIIENANDSRNTNKKVINNGEKALTDGRSVSTAVRWANFDLTLLPLKLASNKCFSKESYVDRFPKSKVLFSFCAFNASFFAQSSNILLTS